VVIFHIFVFDVLIIVIMERRVVPCVDEVGMMRRWRRRERKITESGAIAVVIRVVDHTRLQSWTASAVEVFAKSNDTVAREDTKDFALMVVEFGRGFAAEDG
jgi:ATP-dependent exoDNAse (exonuclease V) alpha subunit